MVWLIDDLVDLAQAICTYISQALQVLLNCLLYPFEKIAFWFVNIFTMMFDAIIGIINNIWDIFDILYIFISDTLEAFLPYTLLIVVLMGLTIVFLFRVYRFVKDIEIFGFSI